MSDFRANISRVQATESNQGRMKSARTHLEAGRIDEALSEFETILKSEPNSKPAHMGAGRIKFKQKRFDDARRHYEEVIRAEPMKVRPYLRASKASLALGDLDRAMNHALDARQLSPKSARVYMAVGQIHQERKEYDEARDQFRKALQLNPRLVPGRISLATTAMLCGDPDEAVANLTVAIRVEPDRDDAYESLGRVHIVCKRYAEAREAFEKAIELNPDTGANAYLGLAESCIQDDLLEQAEEALRAIPKRHQFKAQLHQLWGDIYFKRGEYSSAIEEYRATELMLSEAGNEDDVQFSEPLALRANDPKWKELAEAFRENARTLIEMRRRADWIARSVDDEDTGDQLELD